VANKKKARLTIDLGNGEPPREFRVFKRGMNKTTKGDFVFDDDAAKLVMGEYRKHGVDVMIDLEHLSLDSEGNNYDPSAYGWCKLELRGGELWATNVSWTEAGAARLRKRESRYISPAFHYLADNGRITEIYNIAICAVPATYETPALVAASKRVGKQIGTLTIEVTKMDVKKIIELLGLGEDATLEDILNAIKALQDGEEGGDSEEETADDADAKEEKEEATDDEEDAAMAAALKDLPPKVQAKLLAASAGKKVIEARLAKLEKDHKRSAVEALIAANVDKLPKGLEAWARSMDVETLSVYFKNAPAVDKKGSTEPKRGKAATTKGGKVSSESDDEDVELTPEDIRVAKLSNTSRDEFLKMKKLRAKKDRERKEELGIN
jgi:phage I-like protein